MQANPAPALKPDRQSLSVDDARRAILDGITPIEGWCSVPVRTGLGRVLAEDVIAPFNVFMHLYDRSDWDTPSGPPICWKTPRPGSAWSVLRSPACHSRD